jgi:hypothetical protein
LRSRIKEGVGWRLINIRFAYRVVVPGRLLWLRTNANGPDNFGCRLQGKLLSRLVRSSFTLQQAGG